MISRFAVVASVLLAACGTDAGRPGDGGEPRDASPRSDVRSCAPCDDDCDGDVDYDFESDVNHCGGCRQACAVAPPGAEASCVMQRCRYDCVGDLLSCNVELTLSDADGCEVDPAGDSENCGSCGRACAEAPARYGPARFSCVGGECGDHVVAIAAGGSMSCAVLAEGLAYCWGLNRWGQVGDGTLLDVMAPAAVGGETLLQRIWSIAAGGLHTCALATDDVVWCWGSGGINQLGRGDRMSYDEPGPTGPPQPPAAAGFAEIDTGQAVSIARTTDGDVYVWGADLQAVASADPVPTRIELGAAARAIGAGGTHRCVVLDDGTVWCWGQNDFGEVGDASPLPHEDPGAVPDITDAVDVGLGARHTCAVSSDGTVRCWGANDNRQCAHPTASRVSAPHVVGDLPPAVAVVGGADHTCALLSDRSVRCWGAAEQGQLGVGVRTSTDPARVATPVSPLPLAGDSALPGIASIAVGDDHSCALTVDGRMICWGENFYGQAGVPTSSRTAWGPRAVEGLPGT